MAYLVLHIVVKFQIKNWPSLKMSLGIPSFTIRNNNIYRNNQFGRYILIYWYSFCQFSYQL